MNDPLPLVRALVDALLLVESAGPDELDPDTAVRGLENMASSVRALQMEDQQALRRLLAKIAAESEDASYSTFVHSVPEMLGLADERSNDDC